VRTIKPGESGSEVADVQHRLVAAGAHIEALEVADSRFGATTESAVRAFQQRRGLMADGLVGNETWGALVESGYSFGDRTLYLRYPYFRGDDVRALQRRLNALGFDTGREDGIFGERCDAAVREFQRNVGSEPDGIVGLETLDSLARLRPPLDAPGRAAIREVEELRKQTSSLSGSLIAIDAGHGGDDPGVVGPTGLREADAAFDVAMAVARELGSRGAATLMLRGRDENPLVHERARAANAAGASICLSFHLNDGDPAAEGSVTMYFGTPNASSVAGERLAEWVQAELTSRLGLKDGRTQPMTFAILRETRMPAVQIEPCFISNAEEERLLGEEGFLRDIAIAVVKGVERFLGPPVTDQAR
jgi:N-acetylmuramoyl-L-alanine amidase